VEDGKGSVVWENPRGTMYAVLVPKSRGVGWATALAVLAVAAVIFAVLAYLRSRGPSVPMAARAVPEQATSFCPYCGKPVIAGMPFCGNCGRELPPHNE
jgi:peptidoglycan/LPS O-acetylase OafA/YrhL